MSKALKYLDKYFDHLFRQSEAGVYSTRYCYERARCLNQLRDCEALSDDPEIFVQNLPKTASNASKKVYFSYLVSYFDWLQYNQKAVELNPYSAYRAQFKRSKIFRAKSPKKKVSLRFHEAVLLIQSLDAEICEKALQLLHTGMRWHESFSLLDGRVVGKGDKVRDLVPIENYINTGRPAYFSKSYTHFHRCLKQIGLAPHDLRRLYATKCVELGCTTWELKERMGHASITTTERYVNEVA